MTWGHGSGARLRRMAPLAAAIALTTLGSQSPLSAQNHLGSIEGVQAAAVEQGMWGLKRSVPKAGAVEVGAIARYTVMFKGDSVVGHLSRQASPPRISSGRPGSIGRLDMKSPIAQSYARALQTNQLASVAELSQRVGRDLQPVTAMQHALNAVVLDLTPAEAEAIAQHPAVDLVEREEFHALHTYAGPAFIGAASLWNGTATGVSTQGEGMIVGVIDTGVNFDNPAFAGTGPVDGYVHANPLGEGNYLGTCAAGGPDEGKCNAKLFGAYNMTAVTPTTAEDTNGHGSHTASTAAGNTWEASFNGLPFTLSGVAPHANLIVYKACPTDTCPTSAQTASVNQAIIDGVDAINFSIGGGTSPWTNTPSVAFRNAMAAGVFVAASAGNDGPGADTVDHLEPWTETVAASTHDQQIASLFDLVDGPAQTQDLIVVPGSTPWPSTPQDDVPVIESPTFADGTNDGCTAFAADTFVRVVGNPDIVFSDSFEDQADPVEGRFGGIAVLSLDGDTSACPSGVRRGNALAAGAVGVIFVDDAYLNLGASGTTWSMLASDWATVKASLGADPLVDISTAQGVPAQGDVLVDFSSRGPRQLAGNQVLVKPEIAAPGNNIMASLSDNSGSGGDTSSGLLSGTSMASPHVAGAALLLRSLNPGWSPMQVKSALNLTADKDDLIDFDGAPVGPLQIGSGRVSLQDAARVGLVMDETAANFAAANPAMGGNVSSLNLAQFANGKCIGECSFTRTFRRARAGSQTYTVGVSGLPDGTYSIAPSSFTINSSGSRSITLEVAGDQLPPAAWAFGEVTLTPASDSEPVLRMPIAINSFGPVIEVDPTSVSATTVATQTMQLEVANTGNPTLEWELETDSITKSLLDSSFQNNGQQGGFYNGSGDGFYWLQNFDVGEGGSDISLLQANGFVLPGSVGLTASNTTGVTFEIYDESGTTPGTPDGAPTSAGRGFGEAPRWTYTNTIGTGGVVAQGGFVALDLTDPAVPALDLPPGRYWMTVFPSINGTGAQTAANPLWAWFYSPDPQIGARPLLYRPTQNPNGFFTGTNTFLMSAIIEGTVSCALPSWLSVDPTSGSLGLGGSQTLDVTFDASALDPGEYSARICLRSNAVNAPELEVPVTLTVPANPFPELAFSPSTVAAGALTDPTLTITLINPSDDAATLTAPLVHAFPDGHTVSLTPNAATDCASGMVGTTSGSVTLGAGAVIPADGSCTVTVNVDVPAAGGSFVHTIPVDALQTSEGNNLLAGSATLTVTAPQFCSGQPLLDPGFELTDADDSYSNPVWNSTSTNGGSSLCDGGCGASPRSGAFYVWFGGWGSGLEAGTATQTVTIPAGFDRRLNFWHRRGFATVTDPSDAAMTVSIDGNVLQTFPRVTVTETAYALRTIDIPAQFEDGNPHTLEFRFDKTGTGNMGSQFVDDVTMDCATPTPAVSKEFGTDTVEQGDTTSLTLTLTHSQMANVTVTAPLVDALPAGMVLAMAPNASTTCPAGVVTAVGGAATLTLEAGARIPPGAGCTVTATVQAVDAGDLTNTIPAGGLVTNFGNSSAAASDTLRVLSTSVAQDVAVGFEADDGNGVTYTAGPLAGQNGWAATVGLPVISTARPHTGTQHLSLVSAASAPQSITPTYVPSAGRYGVIGARVRLSNAGTGTIWRFAPQDNFNLTVAALTRFETTTGNVQVVEFDAMGVPSVLSVGAFPVDAYFTYEIILDRQTGTAEVCLNGVSLYSGANAYLSGYVTTASIRQDAAGTVGNTYDIDNLRVLSTDTGGCGSAGVASNGSAQPVHGVQRSVARPETAIDEVIERRPTQH